MPAIGQGVGRKLWLFFTLDQPTIVPGQPLSFSVHMTPSSKLDLGTVTATVYLVNDQGTPISPTPLWSATLPKNDIATLQPRQTYDVTPGLIVPPPALQPLVYEKGTQNFSCVLNGTGTDGGPYQAFDWVQVVLEGIGQDWWQWVNPSTQVYTTYQWKNQDYTVNGLLYNRFVDLPLKIPTTLRSGTLSFVEEETSKLGNGNVDVTREFAAMPGTLGNLGQGADTEVSSSIKAKTWPWHIQGTYAINDDLERLYVYRVHLTNISDQYNNQYPDQLFGGINVHVAVDQGKIAASVVALNAFGVWVSASTAAALTAEPWSKLIFAAIASAAATVLGISGKIADDPPGPDPRYRQEVQVALPALPPVLADAGLRPIAKLFEAATRIMATVDALNTVANRMSIAQRQRDTRAIKLHAASRRKMLSQMSRDWKELNNVLTPALATLARIQSTHQTKSIDPDTLQYELPQEARDALAAASVTPLNVSALVDPKEGIRQLADALGQLVATQGRRASKTLVVQKKKRPRK